MLSQFPFLVHIFVCCCTHRISLPIMLLLVLQQVPCSLTILRGMEILYSFQFMSYECIMWESTHIEEQKRNYTTRCSSSPVIFGRRHRPNFS